MTVSLSVAITLLLIAILLVPPASATMSFALGDEIILAGQNPGGQTLYLFLTGPNLPQEGVRLEDARPVITGVASSFTRTDVLADDTWRYQWDTKGVGGIIDPGTYVLYVVTEPAGRLDLAGKEYTSLEVILKEPRLTVVTATTPLPTGTGQAVITPVSVSTEIPRESPVGQAPSLTIPMPMPKEIPFLAVLLALTFIFLKKR
ncbi:MAG: hypothetical protein LUQ62_06420 [Methanomicrobiales archaeon]|nr:hypothetical protein [Methanomicrobiales archaeon]